MIPLTMSKPGDRAQIKQISGRIETKRHLADLGFVIGQDITVVSKFAGNLILNVKGSRIALDRAMANKILI